MDEFEDDVREVQQGNAAEEEEMDEESDGELDEESDEESDEELDEESDEELDMDPRAVVIREMNTTAIVVKELRRGRNSDKLANELSSLTRLS
jgi:hypothetical protein